ncbi:MAG: DUF1566 domain-containing protein [Desulfobacula sp.]|jgi:hypothetical protein|nr:DUF1566 domain-containing protein [Desulfobacula sp.]
MSALSEIRQTWQDHLTGLEWQLEPSGEMSWYDAFEYASSLTLGGHHDWRFPNIKEMESFLDRSKYRPVMREEIPFRDKLSYWSSTTFGTNTKNAWIIMLDGAYVLSYYKTNVYRVRCVRKEIIQLIPKTNENSFSWG